MHHHGSDPGPVHEGLNESPHPKVGKFAAFGESSLQNIEPQ